MSEPLSSKTGVPDNSKVICPNCCHQFGAICVDDQKERSAQEAEIERLRAALRRYGKHDGECHSRVYSPIKGTCNCGLAEFLRPADETSGEHTHQWQTRDVCSICGKVTTREAEIGEGGV